MLKERVSLIGNPILEFDSSSHISTDPIFGLENWTAHRFPDLKRVSVCGICVPKLQSLLATFWRDLREGYEEDVYVPYPGFEKAFGIPIGDISSVVNPDRKKGDIPSRYAASVRDTEPDVDLVFVVLPYESPQDAREVYNELKAASFSKRIKTQCIRLTTLGRKDGDKSVRSNHAIDLWNISVGIFTKVGGIPWVLKNRMSRIGCFIGLVTQTRRIAERQYGGNKAGICEVVDDYGSHVIWVKEDLPSLAWIRENGRRVLDIEERDIVNLSESCLDKYCRERLGPNYPDRMSSLSSKCVVFHVTDSFSNKVLDIMERTISDFGLERYQIIHLKYDTPFRLYDKEDRGLKPLHGTFWQINEKNAVLYTHGRR
ncbi:MAG: hypothetical protein OEY31_02570, partial [Candidatus Bathyarchaeota archaeon]|nr:hypothetical protein [Candidatus Bathyarchaeota archaeon]